MGHNSSIPKRKAEPHFFLSHETSFLLMCSMLQILLADEGGVRTREEEA